MNNLPIKPVWIIVSTVLYLIVLIAYMNLFSAKVTRTEDSWNNNLDSILLKSETIESLTLNFGFNGYLQNYSLALANGLEAHADDLERSAQLVRVNIESLTELAETELEKSIVASIDDTFNEFRSSENSIPFQRSAPVEPSELRFVEQRQPVFKAHIEDLIGAVKQRSLDGTEKLNSEINSIQRWIHSIYLLLVIAIIQSLLILYALRSWNSHIKKLRTAGEHLNAIIEASPDAMLEVDKNGVITRANSMAFKVLAAKPGSLVGMSVDEFVDGGLAKRHKQVRQQFMESGRQRAMDERRDLQAIRLDGKKIDVEISLNRFVAESNPLAILSIRDVTDTRRLESIAIQNQRIESLGKLTAGIAHDFNNTLTTIYGNSELGLMDVTKAESVREHFTAINHAVKNAASLTARLLAFGRKQALKTRTVELDRIVNDMEDMLNRTLGENIAIRVSAGPNIKLVDIDSVQMESAILNICLNSKHAMPEGGEIRISISNRDPDDTFKDEYGQTVLGDYVVLEITDDGKGIPSSIIDKVVEPFFSTKDSDMGAGLGLSMVYGFVLQSKGHMKINSTIGLGTTIKIYLPASHSTSKNIEENSDIEKQLEHEQGSQEKQILVIEDDSTVRRIPMALLSNAGYTVYEAETPEEAFEISQRVKHIDLIFCDIVLSSKINGYQLSSELSEQHREAKVLLTTGYAADHESGVDLDEGNHNILMKPYSAQQLIDAVTNLLDAR